MDSRKRSTPSLSSLVQTRSLELVLGPIANHVSTLLRRCNQGGKSVPFPDLMPSTLAIMEAVQDMATVAQKVSSESKDEKLKQDMPRASEIALKAAEQVLEAAGRLSDNPLSEHAKSMLCTASHILLEGTMKVLLMWDDGEVRKILTAAQWVLDRLVLVLGAKSMRGLVICFGGFSESMLLLLSLADKRQQELTNKHNKQRLLAALERLKTTLPKFSSAMQDYVKTPAVVAAKEAKESLGYELSTAVHELMDAVRPLDQEADNMAGNIMEVQRKLTTSSRYFIGPDLDKHLDSIIQNSMAVAHVSRDQYREAIQKLCGEVLSLRKELQDHAEAIYTDPENQDTKTAFDNTADRLCERLLELDRWVADSVVDQVTEAFVETSVPINHLVQAATSGPHTSGTMSTTTATPASTTSPDSSPSSHHDDSLKGLTKQVDLFRRHSRRLSQVAAYAAQSSTNAKRVQQIKVLADSVDHLTPRVVEAAMKVKKEPGNKEAREQLDMVRREWAGRVHQLTGAIDDIIDPEDFMAVSEANIQQDMAKCRDAIQSGKWAELNGIVQGIAAKARRILEVGQTAVKNATDESYKSTLSKAVHRLEKAIPRMLTLCQHVVSNPSSQNTQDQFIGSLRELLEGIHDIQSVLSSGIDVPQEGDEDESGEEEVDVFIPRSSTQSKLTPAQERMLKRNIERVKNQPRYIGSLGATTAKQRGELPVSRTLPTHPRVRDSRHYGTQTGQPQRPVSYSNGFSQSFVSGDVETQTPRQRTKDQALQVDLLSDSSDSFSPNLTMSTTSWTSPISPARTSSHPATPSKVTPGGPDESETMRSYLSPLQKLVTAAKRGDADSVPSHASQLSARMIRLTNLAESAAETLKPNTELARTLQARSSHVKKLVPHVIDQAKEVAMDPNQSRSVDELQISTHQWAGHVRQLVDATQQANLPWSKTADKLVVAARTGRNFEKQMTHIGTQTDRMVGIATMTIEAAETEEAIGSTDDSDLSQDKELREQVEHVKVTASEIEKLTPRLLSAAEEASVQREGSATMEHLNLLAQEWATKAKVLMKGVDDVSLGMGGAADTLLLSAKSGDPTLLAEQTKAIQSLAESMEVTAKDAIEGCSDSDKIRVVKGTCSNIKKLSAQLIECANALAVADEDEESDQEQAKQENSELLRRDWSSQVHLLTAHIDDLTAEVSAPLDRLVDIALQASRTDGVAKQHLLKKFENNASFLTDQLEVVDTLFKEATDFLQVKERRVEKVEVALSFLKKLTPHAVGAARSLASDPGSAMLDHFNHLRRQWASKAQFLLSNLKRVISADMGKVFTAFMDLLHHTKTTADIGTGSPLQRPRSYSSDGIGDEKVDLDVPEPSSSTHRLFKEDEESAGLRPTPQRTKRPASMAVPLPTWVDKEDETDPYSGSSQSIAVAAQSLREVTDVFFEGNNPIVSVAKKMSNQMSQMAEFTRGRGELQSKTEMIHTAKAIAANGQVIARFANIIGDNCMDKMIKRDLQYCVEMIPTLSTQLRIIASVKAVTPDDTSADVMLVKNAQNLMRAVIKTVQAAEAACMKGLKPPENVEEQEEQTEATELARGWKRKLYHQRTLETIRAPRDARGMRKLNKNRISTPSVLDMIKPRQSLMTSPPHKSYKENF